MRISKPAAISAALALGLCQGAASASVITLSPTKKESVLYQGFDLVSTSTTDLNAGNIVPNNTGVSYGYWRFYESFDLPAYEAGAPLTSAILSLTINNTNGVANGLGVFGTAGWTTYFDYFQQPRELSGVLGRLPTAFGTNVAQIDITDYLKSFSSSAAHVGFEVRSLFQGNSWNDLATIVGQSLTLSFAPDGADPHAVPEPDGRITFALGLATLVAGTYLRRKKA